MSLEYSLKAKYSAPCSIFFLCGVADTGESFASPLFSGMWTNGRLLGIDPQWCEFDSRHSLMKKINVNLDALHRRILNPDSTFPTERHKIAWEVAQYFDEPYGMWVRYIRDSRLFTGEIWHEWYELRRKQFTKRQKVRMFMATLYPH